MSRSFAVAWYRFRVTFRRRWTSYLSVVLLIALTGGLAMASVAAARRTQSSYPIYLASTNPSNLAMAVYSASGDGAPGPDLTTQIGHLPYVRTVHTLDAIQALPLSPNGAPRLNTLGDAIMVGSTDGYLSAVDHLTAITGHLANPKRTDQIMLTSGAEHVWGVNVGQTIPIGYYSAKQATLAGFGTPAVKPIVTVITRVTGIVDLNSEIVQDQVDQAYGFVFVTPATLRLENSVNPGHVTPVYYALQLRGGDEHLSPVERELIGIVPRGNTYTFHVTANNVAEVELTVKPESVALGAFGAIAALVCLILCAQSLARQQRRDSGDQRVLRALGAGPRDALVESLLPAMGSVVVGTILAGVVAVALSPLAPIGPVRSVYPDLGLSFDWTVLGVGAAALVVILGVASGIMAWQGSPARRVREPSGAAKSSLVWRSQSLGLPVTAGVGVHFALESQRGRGEVPVRSIVAGAVLAVTLMAATLTFSSGLSTLVSHPALYGWNWTYALNPSNNVPPGAISLLDHDPKIAAWSGVDTYSSIEIDGIEVPMLLMPAGSRVVPPILSGHALQNSTQIVLGNATLALLHRRVGQRVTVTYGSPSSAPIYVPPVTLTIVGSATFPAVGYADIISGHTSMGTGALVPYGIVPPSMTEAINSHEPDPNYHGPQLVFVRMRDGVSAAAGYADMQRIARAANDIFAKDPNTFGNTVGVLRAQQPAQIVNYRTIGSTPVLLAGGLAMGAIVALTLTLGASVRRRRHDLALYKTLGFTRRQVASVVAWQATVDAVIGAVIGVPLGILLGRELWTLFARSINAVPLPTVPVLSMVIIGLGTIVVANLAAFGPGRSAATTPVALVLRAE